MRAIFVIIFTLFGVPTALADDVDRLRQAMRAIRAQNFDAAYAVVADAGEIPRAIVEWHALRAGDGGLEHYERFLTEHPQWPGLPWLQARGEARLAADNGLAPARIRAFIAHNGVQSDAGLVALLRAYLIEGDAASAEQALSDASQNITISRANWDRMAALYPDLAVKYLPTIVENLIFADALTEAEAMLDLLPEADAAVAKARILLRQDAPGINAALAAIPAERANDGGLIFDRMRYRYTHGQREGARELVLAQSTGRGALAQPTAWTETRADMIRSALRAGDGVTAYQLASNHFLQPGERGYADLEFLAGFAALEFNGDPETAQRHFAHLRDRSNTPISLGRAGYWLGRAGDPDGYAFASKFQTSFYGQLAAEAAGLPFDHALIDAPVPQFFGRAFMNDDNVNAALFFMAAGEELLARRFLAHLSESMADNPDEAEALGRLALALGLDHAAVNIGKNLADRGQVITHAYYPMPRYFNRDLSVPRPLALAIARQESEFYPSAQSHVGARGLMQLMPATAEETARAINFGYTIKRLTAEPGFNVTLGTYYLARLLEQWQARLPLAVISYNAGAGRAKEWLELNGPLGNSPEAVVRWLEMIPFDETRNYVQRVLEGVVIYEAKLTGGNGTRLGDLLTQPYRRLD